MCRCALLTSQRLTATTTLPLEILQLCRAQSKVRGARRDSGTSLGIHPGRGGDGRSEVKKTRKKSDKKVNSEGSFLDLFEYLA